MVKKMVLIGADPLGLGRSLVFARTVVMATVSLFGRWLEPYNVAYLCVEIGLWETASCLPPRTRWDGENIHGTCCHGEP
jgi:hypothetical protein